MKVLYTEKIRDQEIVGRINLQMVVLSDWLLNRTLPFQRSTLTVVRECETPNYCLRLPNFMARQSVGPLNF